MEKFPKYVPNVGIVLRFPDGSERMVIARERDVNDPYVYVIAVAAVGRINLFHYNEFHHKPSHIDDWREIDCKVIKRKN